MASSEYKLFKYYEGICSASNLLPELAKVLSLGVKSKEIKDADGNVLQAPYVLQSKNWDIVYPAPDSKLGIDFANMTPEEYKLKIFNQVSKISDTVILKTTTTPVVVPEKTDDDLAFDSDETKASLTMYLELYKPTYIADPEQYPLDCERNGIIPKLKTKEMYTRSLATNLDIEEVISLEGNEGVILDKATSTYDGVATLKNDAECALIATKLINIYGAIAASDDNFYAPLTSAVGTQTGKITFDIAKLAKIKNKDNDLYQLILDTLAGGIDAKTYSQLSNASFYITKNDTDYSLSVSAEREYMIYQISGTYSTKYPPVEELTPEFFFDGIYTPLNTDYYESSGRVIDFKQTVKGEVGEEGNLVIRYQTPNTSSVISERKPIANNHYILSRLFDNLNDEKDGPSENIYNTAGDVINVTSHVSDWVKFSWYKDFEEIFVDEIDSDTGSGNINDGTVQVPLETAGLNSETKLRYWVNTNNDRFSLVLMGNPSLDYEKDRHLISMCHCGKIDSFEGSINDVAGNFALFSSSSTEPCNTKLNIDKIQHSMEISKNATNQEFQAFLDKCYHTQCTPDTKQYYIVLPAGRYFDKENWCKYCIVDTNGTKITDGFVTVHQISYLNANEAIVTIHNVYDESYTLYVAYPYYEEKYVITSGVTRDMFGNVVKTEKTNTYGQNTSDGITSVIMYHTRSKAYFQKHNMMFAATEEYMSKNMYGRSAYTQEYYADTIKLTHGNDGPRGILNDILVIDSESLYPLDELVINKDFEKDPNKVEETFVYFPVTAPFSPLSDSPNSRYGVAIKKAEVEPNYEDDEKLIAIAKEELKLLAKEAWWGVTDNIYPLAETSNGCKVYWSVVEDSSWSETEGHYDEYNPVVLAVPATSDYIGDTTESGRLTGKILKLEPEGSKATYTTSKVKVAAGTTFVVKSDEKLYYGISDKAITTIGNNAQIKVHLTDKSSSPKGFEYSIEGVPFTPLGEYKDSITAGDILTLTDADPNKYLVVYSVEEEEGKYFIHDFACAPLKDETDPNHLLSYPCTISAYITNGIGSLVTNASDVVDYGSTYTVAVIPGNGWTVSAITVAGATVEVEDVTVNGKSYKGCIIPKCDKDMIVKIELSNI